MPSRTSCRSGPTACTMTTHHKRIKEGPVGSDTLESARALVQRASSAAELREALAVVLPAALDLTLRDTAKVLGRSTSWVADARRRFAERRNGAPAKRSHGGRRNQILPPEAEAAFMDEVCRVYIKMHKDWRHGIARGPKAYAATHVRFEEHVRLALERYAKRPISRATAYNLMARVGRQRFQGYEAWNWRVYCERSI